MNLSAARKVVFKKDRRQASRRVCREQWPRQNAQGQEGERVLLIKRTRELRLLSSEEALR